MVKVVAKEIEKKRKDIRFCFIDLFNIRSEEEFYEKFASEILKTTSNKWQDWAVNGKLLFN